MNAEPRSHPSRSHRRLIALACASVLLIVGLLIATGSVGPGAAVLTVLCVGAMGLMMFAMDRIDHH
jgi:hypothetical protein